MKNIKVFLEGINTIAMAGHIKPDGDCIGSCMGLYNYIINNFSHISIDVFLEPNLEIFQYIKNMDKIKNTYDEDKCYDLFIIMDTSDTDRIGDPIKYYNAAKKTLCIDHHISNKHFAMENVIDVNSSSTSEVVYELLEEDKIDKSIAEALYTGIVHDTGVFRYSNTSIRTMNIAANLMSKGIEFSKIIDNTFYRRTYIQNMILGKALLQSVLICNERCIFTAIRQSELDFYGVTTKELSGIVEQLRITEGVECAIFLYEVASLEFKVSLRSNYYVDVSKVAEYFGGGGHIRAAGCTLNGTVHDVVNNITEQIERQFILEGDKTSAAVGGE